jgi:hypothetical protein
MFCPECHSEYRPGFTTCSDCHVDLVDQIENVFPEHSGPKPGTPADRAGEPFVSTTDPQYFGAILDVLDQEHIPYEQDTRDSSALSGLAGKRFVLFVEPRRQEEARDAIRRFQEQFAIAAEYGDDAYLPDDVVPSDFNPDDATVEVWHGDDVELHNTLVECLTNVGIGCATHLDTPEASAGESDAHSNAPAPIAPAVAKPIPIFVLPSDEKRAREVVREIVDASPPA